MTLREVRATSGTLRATESTAPRISVGLTGSELPKPAVVSVSVLASVDVERVVAAITSSCLG